VSSPSKRKGTAFERAVADYLDERLPWQIDRMIQHGAFDRGDIIGVPDWALECKATREFKLAQFVDEAETEAGNAGVPFGAAIVKSPGRAVGDAFVVMSLRQFAEMVA
jgi:hypothetical protein